MIPDLGLIGRVILSIVGGSHNSRCRPASAREISAKRFAQCGNLEPESAFEIPAGSSCGSQGLCSLELLLAVSHEPIIWSCWKPGGRACVWGQTKGQEEEEYRNRILREPEEKEPGSVRR